MNAPEGDADNLLEEKGSVAVTKVDLTERWMAVGRSSDPDAASAGAAATAAALGGTDPKLLVVFCSDAYDLEALLKGINETSGGVPLIGCSTAGEIARNGPGDSSVVVTAFGGTGFAAVVSKADGASADMRGAGARLAGAIDRVENKGHKVLLVLSDGLAGDQQEVVRGAYSIVGAEIPLVGGCAGDDLRMKATAQLFNDSVLTDSLVGAALSSNAPMGIGVRHGWRRVGEPMLVTSSGNSRVYTLNDQRALDVYLDRLDAPQEARRDPEAFTRFAINHPLGLLRRSEEAHIRFIAEADFEDGSLGCIADVPQGGMVWLMVGDEASVLAATDGACMDALGALGEREPLGLLAFDCIARRSVLGEEGIRGEVERIAEHAGDAPVAGFYTYGEIARVSGISGFHNQTLVVLAVS